jgi:hypothetical protein
MEAVDFGKKRKSSDYVSQPDVESDHHVKSGIDLDAKCLEQTLEINRLKAELETIKLEKEFYAARLTDLNKRCEVYQQVFPSRSQSLLAINKKVIGLNMSFLVSC